MVNFLNKYVRISDMTLVTLSGAHVKENGDTIYGVENLSDEDKEALGFLPLKDMIPSYDSRYQHLSSPTYEIVGKEVVSTYTIVNNTSLYPSLVQSRLDTWARERDYDGINDACSYTESAIWSAEALHANAMRDDTWQAFYATTSDDWAVIETELPVLSWEGV